MTIEEFTKLALTFPEAYEEPHFEKSSFRVNKKIFATLDTLNAQAVIKLSNDQQIEFCDVQMEVIFPVKGKWGEKGWTSVNLAKVHKDLLFDALKTSYNNVAPKRLRNQV